MYEYKSRTSSLHWTSKEESLIQIQSSNKTCNLLSIKFIYHIINFKSVKNILSWSKIFPDPNPLLHNLPCDSFYATFHSLTITNINWMRRHVTHTKVFIQTAAHKKTSELIFCPNIFLFSLTEVATSKTTITTVARLSWGSG